MAIDLMDFMHGAALVQIANHKQFTALNKGSANYGHYKINGDRHLFIKYSSSESTTFRFTFTADEKRRIKKTAGRICSVRRPRLRQHCDRGDSSRGLAGSTRQRRD